MNVLDNSMRIIADNEHTHTHTHTCRFSLLTLSSESSVCDTETFTADLVPVFGDVVEELTQL